MERSSARKPIKSSQQHLITKHHSGHETDDAIHLLQIFPEEIWQFILRDVDLTTYHKVFAVSNFFNTRLSSQRIQILFIPVLEILMDYYQKWIWEPPVPTDKNNKDEDDKHQFCQLLNLRLVCRTWKNRVNRYLENLSRWYQTNFNYRPNERESWRCHFRENMEEYFTTEFQAERDFTRFNEKFESTHLTAGKSLNPLPARRIFINLKTIYGGTHRVMKDFYTEFLLWLRYYGQHIWYFNLDIYTEGAKIDEAEFYNRLKDILELLPNLRAFRFLDDSSYDFSAGITENQLNDLVTSYENIELSKHLNHFTIHGLPILLRKQLVAKPSNLTELKITFESEQVFWQFFDGCRLAIHKLNIILPKSLDLCSGFAAIENCFGENLMDLEIWLPRKVPFLPKERIKFLKLRKLQIGVRDDSSALALDFLLGMSDHLEELSLIVTIPRKPDFVLLEKVEQEHEIKFYQHLEKPHLSNVWIKFPKLKWVKVWSSSVVPVWDCKREQRKTQKASE